MIWDFSRFNSAVIDGNLMRGGGGGGGGCVWCGGKGVGGGSDDYEKLCAIEPHLHRSHLHFSGS